ncbi:MAG TPA: hypothetical protein VE732_09725 [Nitrososphaera sp.]|nr:hypothetical protein [Nitrososphaera sp.]
MPHIEGNDDGYGYGVRGTISRLNCSGVLGLSKIGFGMKGQSNSNIQIYRKQHRKPISDICSIECYVQGRSSPETEQSIRDNTQR